MTDRPDDKLTVTQAAQLYGIKPSTFRAYYTRAKGKKYAPQPDGHHDRRTPYWLRSTLTNWRTP